MEPKPSGSNAAPHRKGFVSAVSHMRSFVPAIYDVTVAIPKTSPAPTMLRLFKGKPSVVHASTYHVLSSRTVDPSKGSASS